MTPTTPNRGAATRGGLARRWALRAVLVLAGLLLAEASTRFVLWARGTPWSTSAAEDGLRAARRRLHGGLEPAESRAGTSRLQPYVGWWTDYLRERVEEQYEGGLAAGRFGEPPTYDVWLVGGSVAAIFGGTVKGGAAVFTSLVASDARFESARGGRELRLLSFAHAAHKQPQQTALVAFLLSLGLVPSAVVNLDGFNEVAVASTNAKLGAHPVWPSLPQWGALARNPLASPGSRRNGIDELVDARLRWRSADRTAAKALEHGLLRSALAGLVVESLVRSHTAAWAEAQTRFGERALRAASDPTLEGLAWDREHQLDVISRAWFESSLTLHGICADRGIPYLHVLQPTLHDPESGKRATAEEESLGATSDEWLAGVLNGYPRLRELGRRLDARGVAFLDASRVFADVDETLYYDTCHFGVEGNRILARAMAEAFLELLAERSD